MTPRAHHRLLFILCYRKGTLRQMASHKTKTGDENVKMQKQRIKLAAKPWTKILLVVNVGSLEKRSNQPKFKEQKTRSPKTTAKLI